ncbi:hypothetical protein CcaCcLH18_11992 [Colletotrichum camelliae]|nr:hypothetical protein CcaCcLH18_11992 [Colletotrichum camelliae]
MRHNAQIMADERRRAQNRLAQRRYRERKKQMPFSQTPDPTTSSIVSTQTSSSSAVFPTPASSRRSYSPSEHQAFTLAASQPHLQDPAWTNWQLDSTSHASPGNSARLLGPGVDSGTFLGNGLPQQQSAPGHFGQQRDALLHGAPLQPTQLSHQAWNMNICTESPAQDVDLTFMAGFDQVSPSVSMPTSRWNQTQMPVQQRQGGLRGVVDTQTGRKQLRTGGKDAAAGSPHQHTSADSAVLLCRLEDVPQILLAFMIISKGKVPGPSGTKLLNLLQLNTVHT